MENRPVVIIGAGVAGLTCARYLQQFGISCTVLEASDGVGGRVRTDKAEGFQLDRGFQVFLTNYPEAKKILDYRALDLRLFRSGAIIRDGATAFELKNPLKEPLAAFAALRSPVGTLADKVKILQLARRVSKLNEEQLLALPATKTIDFLRQSGWSEKIIRLFFRPFFGGVFLERNLDTTSNFFQFLFKQFYLSDVAVPARGIGAIPQQMAAGLPAGTVRLNTEVLRIAGKTVYLPAGETIQARTIVLAVDQSAAAPLLGERAPDTARDFNSTVCTYFTARQTPNNKRLLTIHSNDASPVHNLSILTEVAPEYAPEGQHLISVSTQGKIPASDRELAANILRELTGWYGESVQEWRHLRTYRIPCSLPRYTPQDSQRPAYRVNEHVYRCGDYTLYPSLNAAMRSGREVAELIARG